MSQRYGVVLTATLDTMAEYNDFLAILKGGGVSPLYNKEQLIVEVREEVDTNTRNFLITQFEQKKNHGMHIITI